MLNATGTDAACRQDALAYDMPNPELQAAVLDSLLTLDSLLANYSLATRSFDSLIQWTAALQQWRADLYLTQGYLAAAGFIVPDWDMDMESAPTRFLTTWRNYLIRVRPLVDPARAGSFHVVQ